MKKFICNSLAYSSTLTSAIFTIVPEAFFAKYKLISQEFFKQFKTFTSEDVQLLNIIISRIYNNFAYIYLFGYFTSSSFCVYSLSQTPQTDYY